MKKMERFLARAILVWILCVVITGIFFSRYVGLVCAVGVIAFMGCFLAFAVQRVIKMLTIQPLSGSSEPIAPEDQSLVTASMTGRTNRCTTYIKGQGHIEYTEYEIEYSVQGKKYVKWFHMYPGPDLGDIYDPGCKVQIMCDRNKPNHFEVIEICN